MRKIGMVALTVVCLVVIGVVTLSPGSAGGHHPLSGPMSDPSIFHPSIGDGPSAGPSRKALHVVALGDSVTLGTSCGCTGFPSGYAQLLSHRDGVSVSVDNEGVDGLDTAGLLGELDQAGSSVARAVQHADIVVVTIGANDFGDRHAEVTEGLCNQSVGSDCVSDDLDQMNANLRQVVARIHALRNGSPTAVLVTGYWNVFEDGDVARQSFPRAGVAATADLTRRTNAAISAVAVHERATFVDLLGPFQRAGVDITQLLAADGDHPNARGHDLIAHALLAAGLPGLGTR